MKVYGVTGWKDAGKTGLMERLVAEITRRGFTVSTLKHAHHAFDVDQPGKDSFRHRAATGQPLIAAGDPTVLAVASDSAQLGLDRPVLDLDATGAIADFILQATGLQGLAATG